MKNIKICTVVTGKNLGEFLKNLGGAQRISDLIELRVDTVKDLSVNDLELIRKKTLKKAIIKLGTDEGLIKKSVNLGFNLIDIDIKIFKSLKILIPREKLIISYHDFNKTPDGIYLEKIF